MDLDTAHAALRNHPQFNVIDMESGWKCHFIVIKTNEFARTEFKRRQAADFGGVSVWVASPEDVVLSKLVWSVRSGGSKRQLRDATAVLTSVGRQIDWPYLWKWAEILDVHTLLAQLDPGRPQDG